MHEALRISEILFHIFRDEDLRLSDLQHITLVCSVWNEIAVAIMWERPRGDTSILKLLPSDAWSMVEAVSRSERGDLVYVGMRLFRRFAITRALCQADWDQMMKRSRYVRSIRWDNLCHGDETTLDKSVYEHILANPPRERLLPALQTLTCVIRNAESAEIIQLLVGPSLQHWILSVELRRGVHLSDIATAISFARHNCPHIQQFAFLLSNLRGSPFHDFTCVENAIMDLLCGAGGRMSTLAIDMPFRPSLLPALACYPSLHDIKLSNRMPDLTTMEKLPSNGYPSLRSLILVGFPLRTVIGLVQSWGGCRPIETLEVSDLGSITSRLLLELTEALEKHCDPKTMRQIHIMVKPHGVPWDVESWGEPFALHYAHLAPLRAFSNLEYLTVHAARGGNKITDAEYADLVPSWRHLGRIDLLANGNREPPPASLAALLPFARCQNTLSRVAIQLDASVVPPNDPPAHATNESVVSLAVGNAPIANAYAVALYLSKLFPRLQQTGYWNDLLNDPETVRRERMWLTVERIFATAKNIKCSVQELGVVCQNMGSTIEDMCTDYGGPRDAVIYPWDI
ncbi:uncharacterized protein SCHCODRAFT_02577919 [Schizophyllum commune H4-8]|uniref:uncharacterized protein n=1 Tax=Schizophyllum commune (strain H4-8 / FGSC 9210) TaxID=578458 RepID=UPI00215FD664|nr:uncharacterized protein SCHCODRAFT_02577919 [Schizophyllum commune H4-8]KAI5892079.1 hypothetical protein SCHCODRAFT_02577919 [Schizophyllum commune H4-8]